MIDKQFRYDCDPCRNQNRQLLRYLQDFKETTINYYSSEYNFENGYCDDDFCFQGDYDDLLDYQKEAYKQGYPEYIGMTLDCFHNVVVDYEKRTISMDYFSENFE